jgi:hypothetical protein
MREGMKTALAVISIVSYIIYFFISLALTKGQASSVVLVIFIWGIFVFLISLGVTFILGRGGFMLAGWNTMSPEERSQYNEKKMLRSAGIMIIIFSIGTISSILSFTYDVPVLGWILIILSIAFLIVGVIWTGKNGNIYSV